MYTEEISRLYLNKSKLHMFDARRQRLPYTEEVSTHSYITSGSELGMGNYSPDYVVRGYFEGPPPGCRSNSFIISDNGPHELYITGISLTSSLEPYRISRTPVLFSSYWEEKTLGYLFQVVDRQKRNEVKIEFKDYKHLSDGQRQIILHR